MIKSLSNEEAFKLLRQGRLARLGCIDQGRPYVVPVNYYWEGDSAYIHSRPGRKVNALRANPSVCLQIDDITSNVSWQSVLAFGIFEEIVERDERTRLLDAICDRFPFLTPVESSLHGKPREIIVFRVKVTNVTGAKEG